MGSVGFPKKASGVLRSFWCHCVWGCQSLSRESHTYYVLFYYVELDTSERDLELAQDKLVVNAISTQ
jgi:hypothetical protein